MATHKNESDPEAKSVRRKVKIIQRATVQFDNDQNLWSKSSLYPKKHYTADTALASRYAPLVPTNKAPRLLELLSFLLK